MKLSEHFTLAEFTASSTAAERGIQNVLPAVLLDEAKRELVFTFATVQEISYRLGFADPAYFSRFFMKQTGQTPRAWRIEERERLGM